jgi:hypothetical protein
MFILGRQVWENYNLSSIPIIRHSAVQKYMQLFVSHKKHII